MLAIINAKEKSLHMLPVNEKAKVISITRRGPVCVLSE